VLSDEQYVALLMRSVKRGSVLTLAGNVPFASTTQHHFVILNFDPQTNEFLIAVNHTSHVTSRLTRLHRLGSVDVAATTVVFEPGQYAFFPLQTLFDCNSVHQITSVDLLAAYKNGHLSVPDANVQLSDSDLDSLAQAALNSRSVSPIQKRMINPSFGS
jgi:hypothetical protein